MSNRSIPPWWTLDNAAKIFPSTGSAHDSKVFRFVCELREPVEPQLLQRALDRTVKRFPIYRSVMKRGWFWYYGADYQAAEAEYMLRHAAGPVPPDGPECLLRPRRQGRTSYVEAWGPNEFTPAGALRDFDVTELLRDIRQPALIISGGNDLCTPYVAKYMYDQIPNARWELFRDCRHMCFVEDTPRYIALLQEWLNIHD